jgi:hypothetical protein
VVRWKGYEAKRERRPIMKTVAIAIISAVALIGTLVSAAHGQMHGQMMAETTLTGSTIEAVDSTGLNITVKTAGGGDKLSLPVVSPEIMKGVTVGDRVALELDLDGRVVKILILTPTSKESPEPRG